MALVVAYYEGLASIVMHLCIFFSTTCVLTDENLSKYFSNKLIVEYNKVLNYYIGSG